MIYAHIDPVAILLYEGVVPSSSLIDILDEAVGGVRSLHSVKEGPMGRRTAGYDTLTVKKSNRLKKVDGL